MGQIKKIEYCENCGTRLQGEFCHVCGQKGVNLKRPVIGLAQDLIVDTLWIDSRMWRTIVGLVVNPGKIAKNYLEGHRVIYTPPFRIFLFSSLLFFAVLFLSINIGQSIIFEDFAAGVNDGAKESELAQQAVPDIDPPDEADPPEDTENDILEEEFIDQEDLGPLENFIGTRIQEAQENPRLFFSNIRSNMPRVLFLLPAVYLFLLLSFYFYRRKVHVYDCLIISLYMHAALYFYLTFVVIFQATPLDNIIILNWSDELIQFWGIFQSYRVLSTNFGSPWWSVLMKGTLINALFWFIALLLIVTGMAVSLF